MNKTQTYSSNDHHMKKKDER